MEREYRREAIGLSGWTMEIKRPIHRLVLSRFCARCSLEESESSRKRFFGRLLVSVVLFVVFSLLAIAGATTQTEVYALPMFVALVTAVALLPRVDRRAEDLGLPVRVAYWLSTMRVAYLLVAIFLILGLPRILWGGP
jgi:hypothetical protein